MPLEKILWQLEGCGRAGGGGGRAHTSVVHSDARAGFFGAAAASVCAELRASWMAAAGCRVREEVRRLAAAGARRAVDIARGSRGTAPLRATCSPFDPPGPPPPFRRGGGQGTRRAAAREIPAEIPAGTMWRARGRRARPGSGGRRRRGGRWWEGVARSAASSAARCRRVQTTPRAPCRCSSTPTRRRPNDDREIDPTQPRKSVPTADVPIAPSLAGQDAAARKAAQARPAAIRRWGWRCGRRSGRERCGRGGCARGGT